VAVGVERSILIAVILATVFGVITMLIPALLVPTYHETGQEMATKAFAEERNATRTAVPQTAYISTGLKVGGILVVGILAASAAFLLAKRRIRPV